MKTKIMKTFIAKQLLKIFNNEYKTLSYRIEIGSPETKYISYNMHDVVMKDDEWHNITVQFWAKKNKITALVDNTIVYNRELSEKEIKELIKTN